jgi:hypothetical protein
MALLLPGERRGPGLVEVVVAIAAVLGLAALGCASPTRARRLSASVFQAAQHEIRAMKRRPAPPAPAANEGAALVTRALQKTGLRFGTDGSARALWGYLSTSHRVVAPATARPGDIVFFDTRSRADGRPECADHVGIVQSVDPSGRLVFMEARGGEIRTSFVHPGKPLSRRNDRGEVLNTFLRPKKVADPPQTRYFAGEMLCGVARVAPHGRTAR